MQIDRPITIALIFFVVLLLVFFLVMPEYHTYQGLQQELAQKTAQRNSEFDYYDAINKTYTDLQSDQDNIAKINDALPEDPDLGKIIYFLQDTAAGNGLIAKDIFLSKSSSNSLQESAGAVKEVTLSMDLLGDYPSLGSFLSALEQSDRIFEVTNISFGSSDMPAAQSDQSQFQIQQTYVFSLQIKTNSY